MTEEWPTTTCHECGRTVPAGEFCGACGAHLTDNTGARDRVWAFAVSPQEHLFQPNLVSTLFPHLPHRRSMPFRIGMLVVAAALLVLGYLRLTGPSIALAALAVPLLYVLYLYEVEVYVDEPFTVVGATFIAGGVLGWLWAVFTGREVTQTLLLNAAPQGAPTGRTLFAAIVIPLVAQGLMLLGPLLIYATRDFFDEALDGFTFGAASALGFCLAATLVELTPEMQAGLTSADSAAHNALHILERGLLVPFIYASTTGLIAGALWLRRGPVRTLQAHGWTTRIWTAIAVSVLIQVGLGIVNVYTVRVWLEVFWYALTAILLLFWVRVALHHMLLAEAVETPIGPLAPCFHCYHVVPRMAFCPQCGIAVRSTPKTGIGRAARAVR